MEPLILRSQAHPWNAREVKVSARKPDECSDRYGCGREMPHGDTEGIQKRPRSPRAKANSDFLFLSRGYDALGGGHHESPWTGGDGRDARESILNPPCIFYHKHALLLGIPQKPSKVQGAGLHLKCSSPGVPCKGQEAFSASLHAAHGLP